MHGAYPEMSGQREIRGLRISEYFPIDMYGVLKYQAHQIFLSFCQEGLLVHYICHDF